MIFGGTPIYLKRQNVEPLSGVHNKDTNWKSSVSINLETCVGLWNSNFHNRFQCTVTVKIHSPKRDSLSIVDHLIRSLCLDLCLKCVYVMILVLLFFTNFLQFHFFRNMICFEGVNGSKKSSLKKQKNL